MISFLVQVFVTVQMYSLEKNVGVDYGDSLGQAKGATLGNYL